MSLAPWDFLCRLRLGRAFENQIKRLDDPLVKFNFKKLPGGRPDTLLVRIIKLCHTDCGSGMVLYSKKIAWKKFDEKPTKDLIDFVIYRPDVLYDKLRKDIVEPGPELDKIKKIKKRLKNDFDSALFYARPSAVELSVRTKL